MLTLRFSSVLDVKSYAKPVNGNGNHIIRLYQTQPEGLPHPWYFVHRENAPIGGVGVFTIYENNAGRQFVHLLKMKRPSLGGRVTLEIPAGLVGDKPGSVNMLENAKREVREETGFNVEKIKMLVSHMLPVAQGISSELNSFAIALVKGKQKTDDLRDEAEKAIIVGHMNIPIETFADSQQFAKWIEQMEKEKYLVSSGVFIGKALLPAVVNGKVNFAGRQMHYSA